MSKWLERSRGKVEYLFSAEDVVNELRSKIHSRTDLTASAGIAPNTMLAKICSDLNKPDGQHRLEPDRDRVVAFVRALPIRKINGIGNVTEQLLRAAAGVETCADLYENRGVIKILFSETSCHSFLRIALGTNDSKSSLNGKF